MGKDDSAIKQWLSNEVRFADLFNGTIFNGKQIVKPDELRIVEGESNIILKNNIKKGKGIVVKRYRDIIMRWNNEINLAVLACEAQNYIDYSMPIRTMVYDGLTYTEQKKSIWNNLSKRSKKKLSSDEKLSNFRKTDKLIPTITLIFYYNEKEWDGALELYDMLDIKDSNTRNILMNYISNYKVNLVDLSKIQDFSKFKSDLHIIFNMLKYRKDKQKLLDYTIKHKDYFSYIDNDSLRALGELLNEREVFESFISKDREEQDMCQAIRDLINDSKKEGREEARNEAIKISVNMLRKVGTTDDKIIELIMSDYKLTKVEAMRYCS